MQMHWHRHAATQIDFTHSATVTPAAAAAAADCSSYRII